MLLSKKAPSKSLHDTTNETDKHEETLEDQAQKELVPKESEVEGKILLEDYASELKSANATKDEEIHSSSPTTEDIEIANPGVHKSSSPKSYLICDCPLILALVHCLYDIHFGTKFDGNIIIAGMHNMFFSCLF
ncbi:hypothetical protein ACJX0J_034608, partial [Zea mays]